MDLHFRTFSKFHHKIHKLMLPIDFRDYLSINKCFEDILILDIASIQMFLLSDILYQQNLQ